jgi:YVTN family beta-propeller protein
VSPEGAQIYVASSASNTVAAIDASTHAVTRLPAGTTPIGVAVKPNATP